MGDDADVAMTTDPDHPDDPFSMKGTMVSRILSSQQRTVGRRLVHEGLVWAAAR
jgi:hypothetical protein